jgi:hypothetical protein
MLKSITKIMLILKIYMLNMYDMELKKYLKMDLKKYYIKILYGN